MRLFWSIFDRYWGTHYLQQNNELNAKRSELSLTKTSTWKLSWKPPAHPQFHPHLLLSMTHFPVSTSDFLFSLFGFNVNSLRTRTQTIPLHLTWSEISLLFVFSLFSIYHFSFFPARYYTRKWKHISLDAKKLNSHSCEVNGSSKSSLYPVLLLPKNLMFSFSLSCLRFFGVVRFFQNHTQWFALRITKTDSAKFINEKFLQKQLRTSNQSVSFNQFESIYDQCPFAHSSWLESFINGHQFFGPVSVSSDTLSDGPTIITSDWKTVFLAAILRFEGCPSTSSQSLISTGYLSAVGSSLLTATISCWCSPLRVSDTHLLQPLLIPTPTNNLAPWTIDSCVALITVGDISVQAARTSWENQLRGKQTMTNALSFRSITTAKLSPFRFGISEGL